MLFKRFVRREILAIINSLEFDFDKWEDHGRCLSKGNVVLTYLSKTATISIEVNTEEILLGFIEHYYLKKALKSSVIKLSENQLKAIRLNDS